MDAGALLGLTALMSFVAFGIVAWLHVWPRLRMLPRHEALGILIAPHMFRFVGLSFLIPGVVSPALPREFAVPAAYGDLVAAILAAVGALALSRRAPWALFLVWPFNIWGTIDFLHAIYQGQFGARVPPGAFGAAFYIPTVVVPGLLTSHFLIFRLLRSPAS